MAQKLAKQGMYVSIIPLVAEQSLFNQFSALARSGHGKNLPLSLQDQDLDQWLSMSQIDITTQSNNEVSVWRDQGRWLIIPALLLLLPVFRRNWLQRAIM